MKAVLRFISLCLILLIAAIVLLNVSNAITLETSFLSLKVNIGFLILFCAVSGSLVTLLLGISFSSSKKHDDAKLKKQLEGEKLGREVESEKVNQLEAKIKTLEEALKIATEK